MCYIGHETNSIFWSENEKSQLRKSDVVVAAQYEHCTGVYSELFFNGFSSLVRIMSAFNDFN